MNVGEAIELMFDPLDLDEELWTHIRHGINILIQDAYDSGYTDGSTQRPRRLPPVERPDSAGDSR